MVQKTKPIKVLMAQFPLEAHSRGMITVSGMLKNAGMEVILVGNNLPELIVETAVQEDVDVIGISTYCGGELPLGADLLKAAEEKGIKDRTVFLIGGIFPPKNIPRLYEMGFSGVFLTAETQELVDCIEKALADRS